MYVPLLYIHHLTYSYLFTHTTEVSTEARTHVTIVHLPAEACTTCVEILPTA